MKESMKIDILSIVLYDLRHPRIFVATFFTYKSGTRFEFVLIDYAKYFCKSSLVLAESAKFREGNINN